jgi:hypothetical protein
MNINSLTFTDHPVYHVLPGIYDGLGLPDLSSFFEQHFEFTFTLGKTNRVGNGRIRLYKREGHFTVDIIDSLPGVGPIRLQKLKKLLLEQAKTPFMEHVESNLDGRKVYYANFRRPR